MPNLIQGQGTHSIPVFENTIITFTGSVTGQFTANSGIDIRNNVATWETITLPTIIRKRGYVRLTALSDSEYSVNTNPSQKDIDSFKASNGYLQYLTTSQSTHPDITGVVASTESGKVLIPAGDLLDLGTVYDDTRKELKYTDAGAIRSMFATLRNPTGQDVTNYPCRILVNFGAGEVFSPDQLRVLANDGTRLAFQWESPYDPVTGDNLPTYDDGSLQSGFIWINRTITAGSSSRIEILINPIELGQSFTRNVNYTATDSNTDTFTTGTLGTMTSVFTNANAWNMSSYINTAASNFNLFQSALGIQERAQEGANDLVSSTSAAVTQVSHGRINTSEFGYGVVFQDYETVWKYTALGNRTTRMRYRLFADGSVQIERKVSYPDAVASRGMASFTLAGYFGTGVTLTQNDTYYFMGLSYASAYFVFGTKNLQTEHPADVSGASYTYTNVNNGSNTARIGWRSTATATGAGVEQRCLGYIAPTVSGGALAEHARRIDGIYGIAVRPVPFRFKQAIYDLTKSKAEIVAPLLSSANTGVRGLCKLFKDNDAAGALADYQSWCASIGVTNPATSSQYLTAWTNAGGALAGGMEYQARNTQVLWHLRNYYIAAGDAANQALIELYIHAWADACVGMEAASGGAGLVYTQGSIASPSWNAGASCVRGLAMSLAITANSTRSTVLGRINTAFNNGMYLSGIWGIDSSATANPSQRRVVVYEGYQNYEYLLAKSINPAAVTLPSVDLANSMISKMVSNGVVDEWYANRLYRRGRPETQWFAAFVAATQNGDWQIAWELLRHTDCVFDFDNDSQLIDDWQSDGAVSGILHSIRVLIELSYLA